MRCDCLVSRDRRRSVTVIVMSNAAITLDLSTTEASPSAKRSTTAELVSGVIAGALADARWEVRIGDTSLVAGRAVGCLVAPRSGDEVSVTVLDDGRAYITCVLERTAGDASITVEGDLEIASSTGSVRIRANEDVRLVSQGVVSAASRALELTAFDGKVVIERLEVLGDKITTEVNRIKTVAVYLDRTLERFSERVKRAYRTVEESDHLRAKSTDHRADELLSLSSKNTVMTSEQLMKVDGSQIHIG